MTAFHVDIVTRGTEPDRSRTVPVPVFLRYLEHLRWQSILDERSGLADYLHDGHFFVVRSQELELLERVGQQVPLRLYLWVEKIGRSTVEIHHEIRRRPDHALIASAHVVGLWMNTSRRLSRIPNDARRFAEIWTQPPDVELTTPEHGIAMPPSDRSFLRPTVARYPSVGLDFEAPRETPDGVVHTYRMRVRPSDIDIFDHVNAATYVLYCDNARHAAHAENAYGLGDHVVGPSARCGVRYLQEAVVGDELAIDSWVIDADRGALGFAIRRPADDTRICDVRLEMPLG